MPQTHDIGSVFVHGMRVDRVAPRMHLGHTKEIEEPFRHGRSIVVRLFRGWAVVIGRWRHRDISEEDALLDALDGENLATEVEVIRSW